MSIINFLKNDKVARECMEELNEIHQRERKENGWFDSDKNSPQEVIIKPEALDTTELGSDDNQNKLWRPTEFNEYIGQDKLKKILNGYIKGSKKLNKQFPHMLIDGSAGTGKTTIAYIVAKQLGLNFVETVATTIQSQQQFVDKLVECNGGIMFLDEIHMISSKVANFILPILEDFQINGKKIKPFTLLACTTEKGVLIRKFKPLIDRMKIQKTLDPYTINDMIKLINQYKSKMFPDINIDGDVLLTIAKNCRLTPRIAIRYIESFVYMDEPINDILGHYDIVKDGITKDDIKVLELLNDKPAGLKSIASYLGTSEQNYLYQIEGYLLQQGLITITSRRFITEKGKQFLKEII